MRARRIVPVIFVVLSLLLMGFSVVGSHGVLQIVGLNSEITRLSERNAELERKSTELEAKISAIKFSRYALEDSARRELGLGRANEVIYLFPQREKMESGD